MQLEIIPVQAIKSISQRTLLNNWLKSSDDARLPALSEFSLHAREHDPNQLIVWTVDGDSASRTYRARYIGKYATEALNTAVVDKTIDEILPEWIKDFAVETINLCADTGCAIYMILSGADVDGQQTDLERLLLPFASKQGGVKHIITSLQLISMKGRVDRRTVLRQFENGFKVVTVGKIAPSARNT